MRTRIKFCGCTSLRDVELAVDCGVDAIGVIFAASSPRQVSLADGRQIAQAVPAFVERVAVFVDPTRDDVVEAQDAGYVPQFSGAESAADCESAARGAYIKVHHIAPRPDAGAVALFAAFAAGYGRATWMLDTAVDGRRGGTGRTFDWDVAAQLSHERRIIVSGGLSADNVGACIRRLRPYGVDVRSGIETGGVKDAEKMRAFVRAVKEADEQT